jgi:hypothetical protein
MIFFSPRCSLSLNRLTISFLGIVLAVSPASASGTPCDTLRGELRQAAAQGANDETLLQRVLDHASAQRTLPQSDCNEIEAWMKQTGLDGQAMAKLKATDSDICGSPWVYDARDDGGFIALVDVQGGLHCLLVQVILVDGQRTSLGWSSDSEYCGATFMLLRVDGVSLPAVVDIHSQGAELSHHIDLFPARPDVADCEVSIAYTPEIRVEHWFGPKGDGDIEPELRRAIEPILLELGAGRDAASLIAPLRDPMGDPVVDVDDPRSGIAFSEDYYENYNILDGAKTTPLLINGHHLSLTFGTPMFGWRPLSDFGFTLYEWDGRAFQAVASGFMAKRGIDPKIN